MFTGKGGTGKSYVIHRLLQIGNQNYIQNEYNNVKSVWKIANNNLNAVDIDRIAIASLLHQIIEKKQDESNVYPYNLSTVVANLHVIGKIILIITLHGSHKRLVGTI